MSGVIRGNPGAINRVSDQAAARRTRSNRVLERRPLLQETYSKALRTIFSVWRSEARKRRAIDFVSFPFEFARVRFGSILLENPADVRPASSKKVLLSDQVISSDISDLEASLKVMITGFKQTFGDFIQRLNVRLPNSASMM
jgi:hypothetical protein